MNARPALNILSRLEKARLLAYSSADQRGSLAQGDEGVDALEAADHLLEMHDLNRGWSRSKTQCAKRRMAARQSKETSTPRSVGGSSHA